MRAMPRAPGEVPYTEIAPPADLAPYVDRIWLRTSAGRAGRVHRVLPDGCVDLIVDAGRGAAEIVGTMTRAIEVPDGPSQMIAVRFRPGTATALVGAPLAELTDRTTAAGDLDIASDLVGSICDPAVSAANRSASSTASLAAASFAVANATARSVVAASAAAMTRERPAPLPARIPIAAADHARVVALVAWLRARLADADPPDRMISRAVALLTSADARVDDVADRLGVTRQHLARSFRREVGISPKQLARIARMQRAAAALRRGGDLAMLAAEFGYFDQSHLSHELRDLVGLTPAAVAAEQPIALSHLFR